MYLLAPFILQNFFKNSQGQSRVMRMCHFHAQIGPFVMNKIFLVKTVIITFIYLLTIFIMQNLKKFLQRIQSYEDAPFLDPKWSICAKHFFFHSYLPISPFHWGKFKKKSSSGSRVSRMHNVWAQNGPFSQMTIFFRKPANELCFFQSCLSLHVTHQGQILIYQ